MTFKSGPQSGLNSTGLACLKNNGTIPVRVEFIRPDGFLYVRDEHNKQLCIHHNNFTMLPTIPSRHREYNWRLVEPIWAKAVAAYPTTIVVAKGQLSHETLARKLREARYARDRYVYPTSIDKTRWEEISPKIAITPMDDGTVRLGPSDTRELVAFEAALTSRNEIHINWANKPDELERLCALLHAHVFDPKPNFVLRGLTDQLIASLEERYDVGFALREDKKSWVIVF